MFNTPAVNTTPLTPAENNAPAVNIPLALSATDTELSLSLPAKTSLLAVPVSCSSEAPNCSHAGIPYDKSLTQWVPKDKKDEMIVKLVPRVRELQNQLQEWTDGRIRKLCKQLEG
ncbi:RING/U-box superfamily protein [Euphorbia peplus]|nr:RING/U-box superfamily protein [Euphorbia peplus]